MTRDSRDSNRYNFRRIKRVNYSGYFKDDYDKADMSIRTITPTIKKKRSITKKNMECNKVKRSMIIKREPSYESSDFIENEESSFDYHNRSKKQKMVDDFADDSIFSSNNSQLEQPYLQQEPQLQLFEDTPEDERVYNDLNGGIWYEFNEHDYAQDISDENMISKKEWVSATKIKNYLLKDPIIDWLDLYYYDRHVKSMDTEIPPHIQLAKKRDIENQLDHEKKKLQILFEMGNKFEDKVIDYISIKFNGKVKKIINDISEFSETKFTDTVKCMMEGVPIIVQAPLFNYNNMTNGVADILVRSDYINKLVDTNILTENEETFKAPNLNGNYHYRVIDIKWTTMTLCANGKSIRNSGRFPAYKGQIAIYNAALGLVQGYTPNIAYILSKSWKYESKGDQHEGFNCFNLLGEIDYDGFDQDYLDFTKNAIKWIRNVRYNGHKWSTDYPPTVEELYPNMNNKYDTPFHRVKKDIASKNHELTDIYMVGVKNRQIAHKNGVYKWSDENCNAKTLGINGGKVGPLVDAILDINKDKTNIKIKPSKIKNNEHNWQTKSDIDFYVDYEMINGAFYNRQINLQDCKEENGVIFMIGVGYRDGDTWFYKSFNMSSFNILEERKVVQEFIDFIEDRVKEYMIKNGIYNRNKVYPSLFHWGHVERTVFQSTNYRHGNIWSRWSRTVNFVDFCEIIKKEPVVVKGAKKFGLKEVAKAMKDHKFISSIWSDDGPSDGLTAMIEAANYYRFMDRYNTMSNEEQLMSYELYSKHIHNYSNIIKYNEIDCKTVMEIIDYLRNNHC